MNKAFFLDRDGVINKDHGYVHTWDKFEIIENTFEALLLIKQRGYKIVVITNQAGIARGYYKQSDYDSLMAKFLALAIERGVTIDGVYHCPHHPFVSARPAPSGRFPRAARHQGAQIATSRRCRAPLLHPLRPGCQVA